MVYKSEQQKMRRYLIEALEKQPKTRKEAIEDCLSRFPLTKEESRDTRTNSKRNILKSRIGTVFSELCTKGILLPADRQGHYKAVKSTPVVLREAKCEAELLSLLKEGGKTRAELRARLSETFGTDKTPTESDDTKLYGMISEILRRLCVEKTVTKGEDGIYSLVACPTASPTDAQALSALRARFLEALHAKGGEFFEHYLLNLLEKYLTLHGKTVTENRISGGAEDGGIDGILHTVDSLGFREEIMVQAKNRNVRSSEREVRGFYGAVCAVGGSRGIFASTGGFHPSARDFLDAVDNCVGIDGYRIFEMACETKYGIKKSGGVLATDKLLL